LVFLLILMPSSRRRPKPSRLRKILPIIVVIIVGGVAAYLFASGTFRKAGKATRVHVDSRKTPGATSTSHSVLEDTIRVRLHQLEVPDSTLSFKFFPAESTLEIRAAVPMGEPLPVILHRLSEAADGTAYHVDDCFCPADRNQCDIRFVSSVPGQRTVVLTISRAPRFLSGAAEMAIVITGITAASDDVRDGLLSLPAHLTFALPPAAASVAQAKRVAAEQKEVLLLLPMESSKKAHDEFKKFRLMIHYPEDQLRSLMRGSMALVPRFAGFSNLGGSRALEDSRVMTIVFSEMKRGHIYFLEQACAHKSTAAALSEKFEMPYAAVNGTIDTAEGPSLKETVRAVKESGGRSGAELRTRELLIRYALDARKRGKLIITAQASSELMQALNHELPSFERSGIKLTFVSQLLDTAGESR
jgi:polysaccharide deacetylase 2 family uncharacterized protein YibQ